MKTKQFLGGIKEVEFAKNSTLKIELIEKTNPGTKVKVEGNFEKICIEGLASLEVQQRNEKGQVLYETVLRFAASDLKQNGFDLFSYLHANQVLYRLTTVTGQKYLLGIDQKPFPTVACQHTNSNTPPYLRVNNYEISYISTLSVLEIVYDWILFSNGMKLTLLADNDENEERIKNLKGKGLNSTLLDIT